jgi:hypothetical protein
MEQSTGVREGILRFYERFSAGETAGFEEVIAAEPGVSVVGTGPDEGHGTRADWVATYDRSIREMGLRLEADDPSGYEEGSLGFGVDRPAFVLPDGSRLPTRMTGVLRREDGDWRVVHLHFSVGVPDEQAIERAST